MRSMHSKFSILDLKYNPSKVTNLVSVSCVIFDLIGYEICRELNLPMANSHKALLTRTTRMDESAHVEGG